MGLASQTFLRTYNFLLTIFSFHPPSSGRIVTQHQALLYLYHGSTMSDSDSIKAYQILRHKLPALRFDDGDVVVKLGIEPESHLLVHSDMIKVAMPTLAPMFKAEWSTPETIVHPTKGKEVKVYSLGMKSVDNTLLLEGKVSHSSFLCLRNLIGSEILTVHIGGRSPGGMGRLVPSIRARGRRLAGQRKLLLFERFCGVGVACRDGRVRS